MITLISKLFILFAYLAQILGIVLIGVGIFVPELRFYLISRAVVLMILGGFGFYFHDTLDDWLEGKRHKKWKAKQAKLEASVQTELDNEPNKINPYIDLNNKGKPWNVLRILGYCFLIYIILACVTYFLQMSFGYS